MIVLFGATGHVGGLTAEAMVARGLAPVLAGREPARLAPVARRLGLETVHADVHDRTTLFELVTRDVVLVSTVGPFARLGWAAVRAATNGGAAYLDPAAEPRFVRSVHGWFGPQARDSGAALLTGFGFGHVAGVLAGALALREAGPDARRVDIGYLFDEPAWSRASARSAVGTLLDGGYTWRGGELHDEPTAARSRAFTTPSVPGAPVAEAAVPAPDPTECASPSEAGTGGAGVRGGPPKAPVRRAVTVGASEQIVLPRLAPDLTHVDVYLGVRAATALHAVARVPPHLGRVRGARRLARGLGDLAARACPPVPGPGGRAHVVAEAFDGDGTLLARTRLSGPGAAASTAGLLAWGAGRGVHGTGALDAVTAFGLDDLVAGAREVGIVEAG